MSLWWHLQKEQNSPAEWETNPDTFQMACKSASSGISHAATAVPCGLQSVNKTFPGRSKSKIIFLIGSRTCGIVQIVEACGEEVIPIVNVFSWRNLMEMGKFKQYRMMAPHDTTLPKDLGIFIYTPKLTDIPRSLLSPPKSNGLRSDFSRTFLAESPAKLACPVWACPRTVWADARSPNRLQVRLSLDSPCDTSFCVIN